MTKIMRGRGFLLLSLGIFIGLLLSNLVHSWTRSPTVMAQEEAKNPVPDLAAMQADIAHLKEVVPSQSHTMTDVGYQFANLWFAGKEKNWPLADFFLNESRQHIAWTIRIRPVRKDSAGNSVDLKSIFDVISNGPLKNLTESIKNKDEARFEATYKQMLNGCNSCHVASDKPYLHLIVPQSPPQTIVSFVPES
jgi:hypothetical protein